MNGIVLFLIFFTSVRSNQHILTMSSGAHGYAGNEGPERGVGLAYWNCSDAISLDVSWFYNWQPQHPCPDTTTIPWIPMIWGERGMPYVSSLKGTNYDALLSFNEPSASNQADMSVDQAIAAWPQLMATGLRLGAPCVTQWGINDWLPQFMSDINSNNYTVDFLCFHWYAYGNTQSNEFYDYLKQINNTYPGYTIWITEFANATGNANYNEAFFNDAYDFMTKDFSDIVERYAWFTNRQENDVQGWDLISWSNGQPTDLGNLYKSKPNNGQS